MPNERNIQCAPIIMGKEGMCVVLMCVCDMRGTNEWPVRGHSIVEQALEGISSRTFKSPMHTNMNTSTHIHTSNNNYYYKTAPSIFVLDSCILNATRGTVWSGSHIIERGESRRQPPLPPRFPLYPIASHAFCVIDNALSCSVWSCWLHYFFLYHRWYLTICHCRIA